jgi:hypothetical protein
MRRLTGNQIAKAKEKSQTTPPIATTSSEVVKPFINETTLTTFTTNPKIVDKSVRLRDALTVCGCDCVDAAGEVGASAVTCGGVPIAGESVGL